MKFYEDFYVPSIGKRLHGKPRYRGADNNKNNYRENCWEFGQSVELAQRGGIKFLNFRFLLSDICLLLLWNILVI
jgi:hypothetical protein